MTMVDRVHDIGPERAYVVTTVVGGGGTRRRLILTHAAAIRVVERDLQAGRRASLIWGGLTVSA